MWKLREIRILGVSLPLCKLTSLLSPLSHRITLFSDCQQDWAEQNCHTSQKGSKAISRLQISLDIYVGWCVIHSTPRLGGLAGCHNVTSLLPEQTVAEIKAVLVTFSHSSLVFNDTDTDVMCGSHAQNVYGQDKKTRCEKRLVTFVTFSYSLNLS